MVMNIKEYEEKVVKNKETYEANLDLAERKSTPVHPGEILEEEFMKPLGIGVNELARAINVSPLTISQLVNKKRGLTPHIAWRLAKFFGTTPEYWLKFQNQYDLWEVLHKKDRRIKKNLKNILDEIEPVKV